MTELLPCPFCGGDRLKHFGKEIQCQQCQALGPLPADGEVTHQIATDWWNRRAPAPQSKEPGDVSSTASPGSPPTSPISVASSTMLSANMEHNASIGLIPLDRLSTSAQGQDADAVPPAPQTKKTGYRNENWKTDNVELESALDAFWNVAYTQGHEQRGHDDEAGTAQKAEDELRRVIASQAPQTQTTVSDLDIQVAYEAWLDRTMGARAPITAFYAGYRAANATAGETCPTCGGAGKEGRHSICRDCDENPPPAHREVGPTDSEVRSNPGLIGREAYEASLKVRPRYDDGRPRTPWDQLGEVERWSWERRP